ncbi:MAG: hypothetical protein QXD20_09715 [Ignisphaera sp.]
MKVRGNFSLVDTPYNIIGLETYDFVLGLGLSGVVLILAFLSPVFILVWFFAFVGIMVYIKSKKRGRGWGYFKRWTARKLRDITGKKVIYA